MNISITIDGSISSDEAWTLLEQEGLNFLYGEENTGQNAVIVAFAEHSFDYKQLSTKFSFIVDVQEIELPDIDWDSQWAEHGLNYYEGLVHVDLNECGIKANVPQLILKPGPGFGDLSHPTTLLVMKLMSDRIAEKYVLDVGCGSGILSLCAQAMDATWVHGLDIDEEAIGHSKENAVLNQMENVISFSESMPVLPKECHSLVVLMNMVIQEQEVAWESLKQIHQMKGSSITSGILKEQREDYLCLTESWGWSLVQEAEKDGWLGFVFLK